MAKPNVITSHLSAQDAAKLHGIMSLTSAPIAERERAQLRRDIHEANIVACAKRQGKEADYRTLMDEARQGAYHFELGCWLYYYSRLVSSQGVWARIDCVRRLLLSDYPSFGPSYDFFTVFDFGERQFDACFEMGDSADVVRSLIGLRGIPAADKKFAEAGWTEDYLLARGYLPMPAAAETGSAPVVQAQEQAVNADGQGNLFAFG